MHPYLKRRKSTNENDHKADHHLMDAALKRTLGVPLFQEQLMRIAVDVAGFDAGEADELRRAMGAKRSTERMNRLKQRFYDGMAANDITGELADGSTPSCSRSPTSAFRRATRTASRTWSFPAPTSSATTRPRSAPVCCAPSRWGSTRRSPWSRTRAGTALWCAGRTSTPASSTRTWNRIRAARAGRALAVRRCGWGSPRYARSAPTPRKPLWRNERRTARSRISRIWATGCG